MAASDEFTLINKNKTGLSTASSTNWQFNFRSNYSLDKGVFLFSGLYNNIGTFLIAIWYRMFEFNEGSQDVSKWITLTTSNNNLGCRFIFNVGSIPTPQIYVPAKNSLNVYIRFLNVPQYSTIDCVSCGGYNIYSVSK